jgi:hypothetical protein
MSRSRTTTTTLDLTHIETPSHSKPNKKQWTDPVYTAKQKRSILLDPEAMKDGLSIYSLWWIIIMWII